MGEDRNNDVIEGWTPISKQPAEPISGWRPIDVSPKTKSKEVRIGDELPAEYQEVLDDIKPDIPQSFQDSAQQAAYYFWSLEENRQLLDNEGNSLQQNTQRLAEQIATSGLVNWVYACDKYNLKEIDPKKSLPYWITSIVEEAREIKPLTEEEVEKVKRLYGEYTDEHAVPIKSEDKQTYHNYKDGTLPTRKGLVNNFKYYVEDGGLRDAEGLRESLDQLREEGVHPHQSKLFEGKRLVLYWHTWPSEDVQQRIDSVLGNQGLRSRGPAQDSVQAVIESDGSYTTEVRYSNDVSLGENVMNPNRWEEAEYDKSDFFRTYLKLTFCGAKEPTDPYKIGFVPIVKDSDDHQEVVEKLESQFAKQELATYTTENNIIDPF